MSHRAVKTRLRFPDHKPQFSSCPPPFFSSGRCKNVSSVGLFPKRRVFLVRMSLVCVQTHACVLFLHLFIYFPPQNLQWARDVLLGSSVPWQQLKHMPAQGLFCERNKTNLFNVSRGLTPHACRRVVTQFSSHVLPVFTLPRRVYVTVTPETAKLVRVCGVEEILFYRE